MIAPKLYLNIGPLKFQSFLFFGITGYFLGVLLGITLARLLHLQVWTVLLMSGIGAFVFFLLSFAAKWITGEEMITYYHHEIAILIFTSISLKLLHLNILSYLDISILGIGTFLAFGRIGCFSVGCCHGKPSNRGVSYGSTHVDAGFTHYYSGVKIFPVQLVESAFVSLIVVASVIVVLLGVKPGTILVVYTVLYGSFRFAMEFFRGDPERPYWQGLSEAQWTTWLLVGLSLLLAMTKHLPLYFWHSAAFFIISGTCIFVMAIANRDPANRLLCPVHIKQIADGLATLNTPSIEIYETQLGLSISKGKMQSGDAEVFHYTVSCNNSRLILDRMIVDRLAVIIKTLGKHRAPYAVMERQNYIFQIVFSEYHLINQ